MTTKVKKDIDKTLKAWGITIKDILEIPKVPNVSYDLIRYQRSCLIQYLVLNKRMSYIQISEEFGIPFGTVCKTMLKRQRKVKLQLQINGVKKSIAEWASISGIPYGIIYYRANTGCPEDEILSAFRKHPTYNYKKID